MARRGHLPEQIINKLREADRLLAKGSQVADVTRQLEISEATYHRWRAKFGGMEANDAKRLTDLERENAALRRQLAAAEKENEALRKIAQGKW
jgi:putative transposase